MSLALYRKYRPGTFAEVKGQEHVTAPLRQALRNGRVHHAYLFSGPRGCGKTSSARILARSLNCEQGPTPDPCGECESCVALAPTGPGSIDVIEIDAASHGGVDDARDLRERAFFAPVAGRYKIYVIDEAHMVTREGFNALLKLVEEPPPHLKFIFATTEPEKVIGTIKSRTHHYPFRLVPPGTLRELLEGMCVNEGVPVELAALPLVVRAAAGSVRDAQSILDQLVAGVDEEGITYARAIGLLGYTDASLIDEVVDAFAAGDGTAVFEAIDRVVESGHDPRRFATDLLERFRDLVVLSAVPDAGAKGLLDVPADQLDQMAGQVARMGAGELSRAADLLNQGLTEMRGATAPRLLLELMCARVLLPAADRGEFGVLARLERLERRLATGEVPAGEPSARPAPVEAPAEPAQPAQPTGEPAQNPAEDAAGSREERPAQRGGLRAVPSQPPPAQGGAAPNTESSGWPEVERPESGSVDNYALSTGESTASSTGPSTGSAGGAGPAPAPGGDQPGPPAAPGALDVNAVRRVWGDVLEAVKQRRKVTWSILMNDVQVAEVDRNVLTLAFARDGDMKGFTGGNHDAVVQEALHEVLGVQWRVNAVPGGQAAMERPRGDAPPREHPEHASDQPPGVPVDAPQRQAGAAPNASRSPREGESSTGGGEPDGDPDPSEPTPAGSGPDGEPAAGSGSGSSGAASAGSTTSSQPGRAAGRAEPSSGAGPRGETGARGNTGAPGSGDAGQGLSGMELIQRELGGQVIREFDNP